MRRADSMLRGVQPLNNHERGHRTVTSSDVDDAGSREIDSQETGQEAMLIMPVLGNTILSSSLYRQPACMWYMCIHASKTPICIK